MEAGVEFCFSCLDFSPAYPSSIGSGEEAFLSCTEFLSEIKYDSYKSIILSKPLVFSRFHRDNRILLTKPSQKICQAVGYTLSSQSFLRFQAQLV
jgi:hypothetical protein